MSEGMYMQQHCGCFNAMNLKLHKKLFLIPLIDDYFSSKSKHMKLASPINKFGKSYFHLYYSFFFAAVGKFHVKI